MHSPKNATTWQADHRPANRPHLDKDLTTDVVIVGGGLVGVMSAYLLAKEGRKVVVLESKEVGTGVTMATTAFLTSSLDTDDTDLIPMFGAEKARAVIASHERAIDLIERIAAEENIECGFTRCSNWVFANGQGEEAGLEEEYRARKRLGGDAAFVKRLDNGFRAGAALELRRQAKFSPVTFVQELARRAESLGVQFYEKTRVSSLEGEGHVTVVAGPYEVRADWVILATYDPLNNPLQTFMKKGCYTSYVFELEIPAGMIAEGTYEDTENPYHYFRVDRGEGCDRMIIGGEDHRHELPFPAKKGFAALREYVHDLLGDHRYTIVRQWSGPIMEPSDGLPLIGATSGRRLVATAFSGNGMTYAAIAAEIFRDLVAERKSDLASLYDPRRLPRLRQLWRKGRDYSVELLNGYVRNLFR